MSVKFNNSYRPEEQRMILIPLFYFNFIFLFCVKVRPYTYNVEKISPCEIFWKNFNVKNTPRKFHEILHLYSHDRGPLIRTGGIPV